jgi:hypothetical protein
MYQIDNSKTSEPIDQERELTNQKTKNQKTNDLKSLALSKKEKKRNILMKISFNIIKQNVNVNQKKKIFFFIFLKKKTVFNLYQNIQKYRQFIIVEYQRQLICSFLSPSS